MCTQNVEVRLEAFRVTHVAATNATITTSQVIGFEESFDDVPYHRAQSGRVAGFENHGAANDRDD